MKYRVKYKKNESGRDFVCGDLHGAYELLTQFMEYIGFDKSKDRMFSVGDLVDRGPMNEECLALIDEPWFFPVKGNHELLMNEWFTDGRHGQFWFYNGGGWGIKYTPGAEQGADPETAELIRRLALKTADLPVMITVERQDGKFFHVIHAELAATSELTDSDLDDEEIFKSIAFHQNIDGDYVMWGRFIFYNLRNTFLKDNPERIEEFKELAHLHKMGKMFGPNLSHIYSGHTIMCQPTRFIGQTNIDTGAYRSITHGDSWAGLTITEPLTDRFWTSNPGGVMEVPVVDISL